MKIVVLFACVLIASNARATSAQDVAAAECRKFIEQTDVFFGGMAEKIQVRCEKRQLELMATGKPNLITNTVSEYLEYEHKASEGAAAERRTANPDTVEMIEKKCAEVGLYVAHVSIMKNEGRSRGDSVLEFKKLDLELETKSLWEAIVRAEVLSAIRKLYDTDADWGEVASEGMRNCQEQSERILFLR